MPQASEIEQQGSYVRMTCASHLIGTLCREDDGESHSSLTKSKKPFRFGEEEDGSGYEAGVRQHSRGMERASSDDGPASNSIQHRQKAIESQGLSMAFSFAQQKLWRYAQRVKNARIKGFFDTLRLSP